MTGHIVQQPVGESDTRDRHRRAIGYYVLIAAVQSGVSLAIVAMRMRRPRSV
jgi:hypothetical protein